MNILLIAIVVLLIVIATAAVISALSQSSFELKEVWVIFLWVVVGAAAVTGITYWALNFFNIIH